MLFDYREKYDIEIEITYISQTNDVRKIVKFILSVKNFYL